ncbi:putative exonuclease, partial [Escherichia coli 8.2524]
KLPLTK